MKKVLRGLIMSDATPSQRKNASKTLSSDDKGPMLKKIINIDTAVTKAKIASIDEAINVKDDNSTDLISFTSVILGPPSLN
jgi:hypothetical protein